MSNGKFSLQSDNKGNDFFQAKNYESRILNGASRHKANEAAPILSYLWAAKQA